MQPQEFNRLMEASAELAELLPNGLVYIGGIAVYMHAINHAKTQEMAETTHDADLYISLVDLTDLREIEELTSNRRLGKHQLIKKGFEFDVYAERQSNLQVPYDEVAAHSVVFEPFRVASIEHLLVLKMAAYLDRKGSVKGEKDARDILRLAAICQATDHAFRPSLVLPYWGDEEMEVLAQVAKGPASASLSKGNAQQAKAIRGALTSIIAVLKSGQDPTPAPQPRRHTP